MHTIDRSFMIKSFCIIEFNFSQFKYFIKRVKGGEVSEKQFNTCYRHIKTKSATFVYLMHSLLQKDLIVRNLQIQEPVLTTEPEDLSDVEGNDESSTYELWAPPPSAMPEYEVYFLINLN